MNRKKASSTLSALAHERRLFIYRLLMKAGDDGMTAGEIATRANIAPAMATYHLGELQGAELVWQVNEGRNVFYMAQAKGMTDVLLFLLSDCCDWKASVWDHVVKSGPPSTFRRRSRRS